MRSWGNSSRKAYVTLDPRLQKLCDRTLEEVADISLICGHRGEAEQNFAHANGNSKLRWPNGRHNKLPSLAVDFQPYPQPTERAKLWASLAYIAGQMKQMALQDGITLRWGGDWNDNGDLTDQTFDDLYHIEIVETANEEDLDSTDVSDSADVT
jgi:hypothetical protein